MHRKEEQSAARARSHTLAEQLQALRTAQRLPRVALAARTGVPLRHIVALEEGRYDALPDAVYVRGFLRSIARILHADARPLITLYEREVARLPLREAPIIPIARCVRLYTAWLTPRRVIRAVAVCIVGAVAVYVFTIARAFIGAPLLSIVVPQQNAVVTSQDLTVVGVVAPGSTVALNGAPVTVGQDGHFQKEVTLAPGDNILHFRAQNRFGKTTEVVRTVTVAVAPAQDNDADVVTVPQTVRLHVAVRNARTWLDIRVDGAQVLRETVSPGFAQEFEGAEIIITSGAGARTFVSRDGAPPTPLADTPGLVKDVRFAVEDDAVRGGGAESAAAQEVREADAQSSQDHVAAASDSGASGGN